MTGRPGTGRSRAYRPDADLPALQALVSAAWADDRPAVRLHPGDLAWRRFQHDIGAWEDRIRVWVDAAERPFAFGWRTEPGSLDVVLGSPARMPVRVLDEVVGWHERATPVGESVEVWVLDADTILGRFLESRGYRPATDHVYEHLFRTLDGPIPSTPIPDGYRLASLAEIGDIAARVAVHRAAFAPSRVTEVSYRRVAAAPLYRPDLDVVAVAPDGSFASYALGWFDPASRSVELEPVGSHPEHRRLGLARTVSAEALRRAREVGAVDAVVYAVEGRPAGDLYRSLGFRLVARKMPWHRFRDEGPGQVRAGFAPGSR